MAQLNEVLQTLVESIQENTRAVNQQSTILLDVKSMLNGVHNCTRDSSQLLEKLVKDHEQVVEKESQHFDVQKAVEEVQNKSISWNTNVEVANAAAKLENEEDRLTLGAMLQNKDTEEQLLIWILSFFTGHKYDRLPRPGELLEVQSTNYHVLFRNLLSKHRSKENEEYMSELISKRMLDFATQKYKSQKNRKRLEGDGKTYRSLPKFISKNQELFQEWNQQLLMSEAEREKLKRTYSLKSINIFLGSRAQERKYAYISTNIV